MTGPFIDSIPFQKPTGYDDMGTGPARIEGPGPGGHECRCLRDDAALDSSIERPERGPIPRVGEYLLADHAGSWPIMQRIAKPGLSRGSRLASAQLSIIMRYNRLSTRMPP
jgi:hypothetical protein